MTERRLRRSGFRRRLSGVSGAAGALLGWALGGVEV
jgi:hypothetical protein